MSLINLSVPHLVLFSGTILTLSSSSWFFAWMGLEINLMAFIPIMAALDKLSTEATLKYYFIQASASAVIFYFSFQSFFNSSNILILYSIPISTFAISLALILKLGVAPFHFWFPAVMEGLSWASSMLLLTWQKIAPLALLLLISSPLSWFLLGFSISSAILGAVGGMNQLLLRKLMAYSSISHMGWIIFSMILSPSLLIIYFMIYSFLSLTVMMLFHSSKSIYLTQLFQVPLIMNSPLLFFNLLSLGGLPPFLGFIPKWMILKQSAHSLLLPALILVMSSVISLYFYLRIAYSALLMSFLRPPTITLPMTSTMMVKMILLLGTNLLPILCLFPMN